MHCRAKYHVSGHVVLNRRQNGMAVTTADTRLVEVPETTGRMQGHENWDGGFTVCSASQPIGANSRVVVMDRVRERHDDGVTRTRGGVAMSCVFGKWHMRLGAGVEMCRWCIQAAIVLQMRARRAGMGIQVVSGRLWVRLERCGFPGPHAWSSAEDQGSTAAGRCKSGDDGGCQLSRGQRTERDIHIPLLQIWPACPFKLLVVHWAQTSSMHDISYIRFLSLPVESMEGSSWHCNCMWVSCCEVA